jgi:hypothetical protein
MLSVSRAFGDIPFKTRKQQYVYFTTTAYPSASLAVDALSRFLDVSSNSR